MRCRNRLLGESCRVRGTIRSRCDHDRHRDGRRAGGRLMPRTRIQGGGSRTAVRGFAGPCLNHSATPPRRPAILPSPPGCLNLSMRIGIIAPPWTPIPPLLYGGIELVVDQLSRGLQDAGHDVLLFTTGDSTCPVPRKWVLPEAEGTRIGMVVPEIRHVIHAYEAVRDCDVVHDHTVMGPFHSEHYPGLPVATTIHGPFNEELSDLYRINADRVPIVAI